VLFERLEQLLGTLEAYWEIFVGHAHHAPECWQDSNRFKCQAEHFQMPRRAAKN